MAGPDYDASKLFARAPAGGQLAAASAKQLLRQVAADRALQSTAISALADDPANQALVERAKLVVAKLEANLQATLTEQELVDLEGLTLLMTRPSLYVRDSGVGAPPVEWPEVAAAAAAIGKVARATGRLERDGEPQGTGFFVTSSRVLTNNHVLWCLVRQPDEVLLPLSTWETNPGLFATRVEEARIEWVSKPSTRPRLELKGEEGKVNSLQVVVTDVLDRQKNLDVAILEVGAATSITAPELLDGGVALAPGRKLFVEGYPLAEVPFYDKADLVRIFGAPSGWRMTKRLAPGLLGTVTDKELTHDASTLGGNSGSPIVDFATGKIIAIHRGGQAFKTNIAVPLGPLADWARGT